jgi:RNA polymerase sigma factor (sigma-70 family)
MVQDEIAVLVRRAADGDEAAWEALFEKYNGLVWWTARRFRLGDEQAADVVQMTWLRLVQHIGALRDPARLPVWLSTTARRRCIDVINQSGREQPLEESDAEPSLEDGPEEHALRRERLAIVRQAMRRLSDRQHQLLTMLVASPPVSYEEISRRLDIPIGSIGPTRARALNRLRGELEATHHLPA